jgi:hypothetical protein
LYLTHGGTDGFSLVRLATDGTAESLAILPHALGSGDCADPVFAADGAILLQNTIGGPRGGGGVVRIAPTPP